MKKYVGLAAAAIIFCTPGVEGQLAGISDTAHFAINQGNHTIGHSDFSIRPSPDAATSQTKYVTTSHGALTLKNTSYSFSNTGTLDKDLAIVSENLNGIVNGSAVTFALHFAGDSFAIDISANGRTSKNSLNRPAQTVFFPDFDLAAYEVLLTLATSHPGTALSGLIPKQTGILSIATLAPQADVQGTLSGKALTVRHSSLTIGSVVSELYFSPENRILEVDVPGQTFAVVRDGFLLQPPPPPPEIAPTGRQYPGSESSQPQ